MLHVAKACRELVSQPPNIRSDLPSGPLQRGTAHVMYHLRELLSFSTHALLRSQTTRPHPMLRPFDERS